MRHIFVFISFGLTAACGMTRGGQTGEELGARGTGGTPADGASGGQDNTGGVAGTKGGTGGAPAVSVVCGSSTCDAKQFPVNYKILSDGSRTALACCAGADSDRCGLFVGGACVELGQPGSPNTQCRSIVANPGSNEATFDACCTPDGTCGYLDSALGLGCFFSTALSANPTPDWCQPDAGTPPDAGTTRETGAPSP